MIILNVGLKIDALGDEFNTQACAWARHGLAYNTLRHWGYVCSSAGVRQSDTELTAIFEIATGDALLHDIVLEIANALAQDCIAMYNKDTDKGELVGVNADKWGEFNKDYFLMP